MGILSDAIAPQPKINWLGVLTDALAGAAGKEGPYASMLMQQRQLQQQQAMQQMQSDRELNREKALFDYESANKTPQPTEYERALQAAGIQPGTPEYAQHMKNYVQVRENPPYFYTDPTSGQTMMIPRTMAPGTPAPSGVTFTPLDDGGPTPRASGGFR
jgi:hypothetical protein